MKLYTIYFLCLIISLPSALKAQKVLCTEKRSSQHTYVKGDSFEGVLFSKDFTFPFLENQSGEQRFTPTIEDVEKAEKLLFDNIKAEYKNHSKHGASYGPSVDKRLHNYIRQYFGYYTDEGEKVIFISCLVKTPYDFKNQQVPNWLKGAVLVINGGSNYWQVQANLYSNYIFNLQINKLDTGNKPLN